ncbi:ArnT family glycosyltransferase [Thermomonospora cellulosilytica]|uniref:4-amino-4-deoxy-L-arabinose transferase-like glycosyltransferase n=1 Tax=Thermomonospora cellulosilytica TaxID=1411118 RepID=A0A7W3MTD9_9ACTN|nr:glycosyltransferase family 39 protein [Thermomonospora cellulosilytica]MBA9001557.1 4-amino-4-deoxy-L-arabinose transferase-like glycosyltransferase [Thermomonospora cellulosilytica]
MSPQQTAAPPPAGERARRAWAPRAALGAILLLATALYGWALGSLGRGNDYYSAAVKSMGLSWTNFLFGAFDPAGVVTVDKPPAGLWPQVIAAKVFGLHGWALLLPQVAEGVLAVLVLHRTVRRWAGERAALIAALVLTLTPITVAITRSNNLDTPLLLLLVCAAYAFTRAVQAATGRAATWWLCGAAFLIGCGFVTKMLAAWIVLPAFALAWLAGAGGPWLGRVWRLLAAGAVLAVSSLWWVVLVALWPGDRPYIGGSTDGGAWDLVIGYNGLGRIFGQGGGRGGGGGGPGGFGGETGPLRMFNDLVAGQISWLLPVSAVAIVVAVVLAVLRRRGRLPAGSTLPAHGWVLWSLWLLVCAAVFSMQEGIFHEYYTTQMAPAIGALCGGLVTALVRAHRAGIRWAPWAGAFAVAVTAGWAVVVIRRVPDWHGWLVWPVLGLGAVAVALLVAGFWRPGRLLRVGAVVGLAAVLTAPGTWSVLESASSEGAGGAAIPTAGPSEGGGGPVIRRLPGNGVPGGMRQGPVRVIRPGGPAPQGANGGAPQPGAPPRIRVGGPGGDGGALSAESRRILDYAVRNSGSARIKLAVEGGARGVSSFILNTDHTVIGMGGFSGGDDAPSVRQLRQWVADGELRYVLGGGMGVMRGPFDDGDNPAAQRSAWIRQNCKQVPASAYGGTAAQSDADGPGGAGTLYDCRGGA